MTRFTFYYTIDSVQYIFAVKHCKKPEQTKVYKHLIKLLDEEKVTSIGYSLETLIH